MTKKICIAVVAARGTDLKELKIKVLLNSIMKELLTLQ